MAFIPQKIRILKFIAEQGVATVDDISRSLFKNDKPSTVRVTLHQLGVRHTKYGDVKHGVWYIDKSRLFDLLRTYFPDFPALDVRPVLLHLVPHSLEMNRIRTALEKTSQITVTQWWSENFIRASLPHGENIANKKIPDAIFWRRRADNTLQKFFLEYERTLKNKDRYEEIFRCYAKREDVKNKNVIYICESDFVKEELEQVEAKLATAGKLDGAGLFFQFVTLESFYKIYSNNPTHKEEKQ